MAKAPSKPVALKEWAVAVNALGEGKQILLMRKGGIHEETREFRLEEQSFYLYPTYFHQKKALVKPEFHGDLEATLAAVSPEQTTVRLAYFAEVVDDIETLDEAAIGRLMPYHIWTETFAQDRLHWKKTKPLHVLLVRTYRLRQPVEIPVRPEYEGCKSWLYIPDPLPAGEGDPVLDDAAFAAQCEAVRRALAGEG
ncbi:MAG: DUF1802 family protein [Calditerricola sp.]|jgi:Uncharacterized protein conserved in bacteria|nr:hypothetical protein [Bacillota bacterium]MCG0313903.1 DUF1802 family protein [Calditerricola sp.]